MTTRVCKDEVENTTTDEMGEYLSGVVARTHWITGWATDRRRIVSVSEPARDWGNTTPGIPLPAVSMEVTLASEQRFRVTVEEIR